MKNLTRKESEELNRIESMLLSGALIEMCEPCDCGMQVRHNNGGNYHTVVKIKNVGEHDTSSEVWMMAVGNTCELIDFPDYEESSHSDCIEVIREAVQEEWEITYENQH